MIESSDNLLGAFTVPLRRRRLVPAKELSKTLGMSLTSVYELTRAGRIPGGIKIGRRILFDADKLEAWLDAGGEYAETKE